MNLSFVTTSDGGVLRAVRGALDNAQRVLMCVAFVREAGLHLLERELKELKKRQRPVGLLVTTTLGSTTPAALTMAQDLAVDVRVFNPGRKTFHAKVYLGVDAGGRGRAFIGSANLTGGLATNVEAGLYVEGGLKDPVLRDAWTWAEQLWDGPVVEYWNGGQPAPETTAGEVLEPELYAALEAQRQLNPVFMTLGPNPKPNHVVAVQPGAVLVETERSKARRGGPEEIPAWMFNLAWEYLNTHGTLTNRFLLNELRVHRSSAVCALLARVPGISPDPNPPGGITLRKVPTPKGPSRPSRGS